MAQYRNGYRHPAIVALALLFSPILFPAILLADAILHGVPTAVSEMHHLVKDMANAALFVREEAGKGLDRINLAACAFMVDHVIERVAAMFTLCVFPLIVLYLIIRAARAGVFPTFYLLRDLIRMVITGKRSGCVL